MSRDLCRVCGSTILISIFKGTGLCSVLCRKADEDEQAQPAAHGSADLANAAEPTRYGVEQPDGTVKPAPAIDRLMAAVSGEKVRSEPECSVPDEGPVDDRCNAAHPDSPAGQVNGLHARIGWAEGRLRKARERGDDAAIAREEATIASLTAQTGAA